jgi:hypothetical protein
MGITIYELYQSISRIIFHYYEWGKIAIGSRRTLSPRKGHWFLALGSSVRVSRGVLQVLWSLFALGLSEMAWERANQVKIQQKRHNLSSWVIHRPSLPSNTFIAP